MNEHRPLIADMLSVWTTDEDDWVLLVVGDPDSLAQRIPLSREQAANLISELRRPRG